MKLIYIIYSKVEKYHRDSIFVNHLAHKPWIYTPSSMKSKIREHLKKIGDNSEQTRNAKHS